MPIDQDSIKKGLSYLMSQKGDKGVSTDKSSRKGAVRQDDAGNDLKKLLKVESTLSSNEAARYTKVAQIFKKILLPKDEAARLKSAEAKVKLPIATPSKAIATQKQEGGDGWLKKLIGPALLILGGLAAFVTGIMSDGPAKGLLKILAKVGIGGGIKWFASKFAGVGKTITKVFKGLGKMLLNPLKGLGAKLLKPFKGLGKMLLKPLKGLGAKLLKPLKGLGAKLIEPGLIGKMIGTVKTKVKSVFSSIKGALLKPFKLFKGGAVGGIFKKVGGMLFKLLKPVLKRIPGIGSMISWAFAVSRFKSGDVVGGLIDVASGIATIFPGIGTAIGIGLDVLNAFLDSKKGKEEKVKPAGSGFKMSDFFGKIKDKIMNNFPIKNLVEFWSGAGMVMSGNFKEGFSKMAFAIPFMKPLSDWLFGAPDSDTGERSGGAMVKFKSFGPILKNALFKKMKAGWSSMPKWAKALARKFMPETLLNELDDGSGGSEDVFNDDMEGTGVTAEASKKAKEKAWGSAEAAVSLSTIKKGVEGTSLEESDEWKHIQGAIPYLKRLRKQHEEYMQKGDTGEAARIAGEIKKREQWKENKLKSLHGKIGERAIDGNKTVKPEMQDFVAQDGNIMPFSNKDSVLGMKTGGAIDQVINQGSAEIKKINQQLLTVAAEQTQLLREIAFNTKGSQAPATNNSGGGNTMQGAGKPSSLSQLNIRKGFTDAYS